MTLNKRRVLEGMFCERALWLRINRPDLHPELSDFDRLKMERGGEAGHRARWYFPDGELIPLSDEMVQQTQDAIAAGATTLFEATFTFDDITIRTDILTRLPDGRWHLIEGKGSSSVKADHYADAAVQLYVLQGVGLDVTQVSLMHLNKEADYAEVDDWFEIVDISAETIALLTDIADAAPTLLPFVNQPDQPDVALGTHCKQCDFRPHCWQHLDDKCVYAIPRLSAQKQTQLQELGIEHLDDLPNSFPLTATQRAYVDALYNPQQRIELAAIQSALAELVYPLYFFDFEADQPFLPLYPNSNPHSRIPYQFSCHILQANGTLTHAEYLHTNEGDPRPAVAEQLCEALRGEGSIIVYNATFERGVLRDLGQRFPQFSEEIEGIIGRLWDQLVIFRKHYHDPAFGGSNSLKAVLPVLVPELRYDGLTISDGTDSLAAWHRLISLPAGDEREQLIADLRTYSRLDTMAMVEIHRVLAAL